MNFTRDRIGQLTNALFEAKFLPGQKIETAHKNLLLLLCCIQNIYLIAKLISRFEPFDLVVD